MPDLKLYSNYSRQDVHDIFSPDTRFTQGSGTWGLQGIIEIPNRPGDFIFFVTFGQHQGDHTFDEWITEDGVISWQSQPRQSFENRKIQQFIHHDDKRNSIYLFLRTQRISSYTYFGRLKYINHDPVREKPVYLFWQLLDWPLPLEVLEQNDIQLKPSIYYSQALKTGTEPENENKSFFWRGKTWQVNYQMLMTQIRDWINQGLPEEAIRFRDWYVNIDGQRISTKWIFHLLTDANYDEFDAPLSRRKLSELGIKSVQVIEPEQLKSHISSNHGKNLDREVVAASRLTPQIRDRKFQKIASFMKEEYPDLFDQVIFRFPNRANWFEIHFPNIKGYYSFRFANQYDEFAYYFSFSSQISEIIVEQFSPLLPILTERFGFPIEIDPQKTKSWGRLGVEIPNNEILSILFNNIEKKGDYGHLQKWIEGLSIDPIEIQNKFLEKGNTNYIYAILFSDLIQETYKILENIFQRKKIIRSNRIVPKTNSLEPYLQILGKRLLEIQQVLGGSATIPSDEVLCDWVRDCYNFELFKEGQAIFSLISPEQVNPWYYERTKKLARLCSMKTVSKD